MLIVTGMSSILKEAKTWGQLGYSLGFSVIGGFQGIGAAQTHSKVCWLIVRKVIIMYVAYVYPSCNETYVRTCFSVGV